MICTCTCVHSKIKWYLVHNTIPRSSTGYPILVPYTHSPNFFPRKPFQCPSDLVNGDGPATCNKLAMEGWVPLMSGVRKEVASGATVASKGTCRSFFYSGLAADWSDRGSWVGMPPALFSCDLQFFSLATGGVGD